MGEVRHKGEVAEGRDFAHGDGCAGEKSARGWLLGGFF